ncbi:hypothetical protein, partial [Streptomyces sp. NRRL F-5755]|uniref:hypothetical protein n=1 Tax=Streptomyces sp. NRRL F-5755 TaxID=1519475 RepID=UPI001331813D
MPLTPVIDSSTRHRDGGLPQHGPGERGAPGAEGHQDRQQTAAFAQLFQGGDQHAGGDQRHGRHGRDQQAVADAGELLVLGGVRELGDVGRHIDAGRGVAGVLGRVRHGRVEPQHDLGLGFVQLFDVERARGGEQAAQLIAGRVGPGVGGTDRPGQGPRAGPALELAVLVEIVEEHGGAGPHDLGQVLVHEGAGTAVDQEDVAVLARDGPGGLLKRLAAADLDRGAQRAAPVGALRAGGGDPRIDGGHDAVDALGRREHVDHLLHVGAVPVRQLHPKLGPGGVLPGGVGVAVPDPGEQRLERDGSGHGDGDAADRAGRAAAAQLEPAGGQLPGD